jgi:hypothetical protein
MGLKNLETRRLIDTRVSGGGLMRCEVAPPGIEWS